MYQDQDRILTIRTLECDICERYDSLLLSKSEISDLVGRNSLQIGSRIVSHGNHLRIIYFDIDGNYLGDTMSLNVTNRQISVQKTDDIPFLIKESSLSKSLIHRKMLKYFSTQKFTISIVGPSMAGKTSLSLFLETGLPERESLRVNHSATMGQSTKHFKLARNQLTVFDMGGQRDFWDLWEESVIASDKVIFVVDGAANNLDEITSALQLIRDSIREKTTLLIIINKLDLYLDGYTKEFLDPSDLLNRVEFDPSLSHWIIQASVYNGLVYNYSGDQHESPLSEAIIDFLER